MSRQNINPVGWFLFLVMFMDLVKPDGAFAKYTVNLASPYPVGSHVHARYKSTDPMDQSTYKGIVSFSIAHAIYAYIRKRPNYCYIFK